MTRKTSLVLLKNATLPTVDGRRGRPARAVAAASTAVAQSVEPKIKRLAVAADPIKKAVLVGRVVSTGMVLQLELEGSESMWMQVGTRRRGVPMHLVKTSATTSSSN